VFKKKTKHETTTQDLIDTANTQLFGLQIGTEEYKNAADELERLHKLNSREKENKFHVSADTLVIAGANLLGIALILNFERLNVVTSKALGFVRKV